MKTRRNFMKGLFGFAGTILAWSGSKKASGETKNSEISPEGQAAINAAGRCVPKGYTLDSESGLPELTERNLNIMINRQLKDFEAKNK